MLKRICWQSKWIIIDSVHKNQSISSKLLADGFVCKIEKTTNGIQLTLTQKAPDGIASVIKMQV